VILRALKLGDLLVATPALRALARAFPMHRRVLCTPRVLQPVVALVGGIDEIVDTEALAPIDTSLSGPAVAVNLHGRGPQSRARLEALRPHRLVSFATEGGAGPRWRAGEHERVRWCRLLEESGIEADAHDMRLDRERVPPPPEPLRGATVIHAGASSRARMWPAERFAAVARREAVHGRPVVLTGSPSERSLAEEIVERSGLPTSANRAGATSLSDLAAIVAHASAVCSGDTGIAHLATGFGTPSVVLFGPVSPREWGPPESGHHRALWEGIPGDPHGDHPAPGLLAIDVDEVTQALDDVRRAAARLRLRKVRAH
jgi:ADP-heptose:LPS heptosyltransferase